MSGGAAALASPIAAADLAGSDETVILAIRPSPWFIVIGLLPALPVAALAVIALLALGIAEDVPWDAAQAIAAGAVIVGVRGAWQAYDWFGRAYVLTDRRIIVRAGIVTHTAACTLAEVAALGDATRWGERWVRCGSIGIMRGAPRVRRRSWRAARDVASTGKGSRDGAQHAGGGHRAPRVWADRSLEWTCVAQPDHVRQTILAAVARYR
jgi:hypothetical protein